jgi:hypothetical protein
LELSLAQQGPKLDLVVRFLVVEVMPISEVASPYRLGRHLALPVGVWQLLVVRVRSELCGFWQETRHPEVQ